jgi:alkylation response protein AidB-like acyl-CoA dehydrogenase
MKYDLPDEMTVDADGRQMTSAESEDMHEISSNSRTQAHVRSLEEFRRQVRAWCAEHIPANWRDEQTGVGDEEFVRFQKSWFAELRSAGYAVPHWPREWGGGMSVSEQIVLYQELAAHDAPRLVLAFVGIHHAASTLLAAGTDEQRRRHLPAILDGEIWVQGFSEPEAGSDLAGLRTSARRVGDSYIVNGQKLWASGGKHADWCLLLARTDPDAPKRKGISYFLLDMTTPGVEVRPIRNAIGDSHFCEIFLNDVSIPAANLVGAENAGWQVAQATLGAERGLTMLELAERLGNAGFRWLVQACPLDDPIVADRLAQFETEIAGLRGLCRKVVEDNEAGTAGPADASIVKLYYSELLQRLTDFGVEIGGLTAHTELAKPMSSGWESGSWVLDFIGSWEWTIPGGSSEIQRTIIAERGLGLPREPSVV